MWNLGNIPVVNSTRIQYKSLCGRWKCVLGMSGVGQWSAPVFGLRAEPFISQRTGGCGVFGSAFTSLSGFSGSLSAPTLICMRRRLQGVAICLGYFIIVF